jgi:hypothetical protein
MFGKTEVVGHGSKVVGNTPATDDLRPLFRGVALIGRAAVSKTVGWGFESLHPCHRRTRGSE